MNFAQNRWFRIFDFQFLFSCLVIPVLLLHKILCVNAWTIIIVKIFSFFASLCFSRDHSGSNQGSCPWLVLS